MHWDGDHMGGVPMFLSRDRRCAPRRVSGVAIYSYSGRGRSADRRCIADQLIVPTRDYAAVLAGTSLKNSPRVNIA